MKTFQYIVLVLVMLLPFGEVPGQNARSSRASGQRLEAYWTPTDGKVGYHMSSLLYFRYLSNKGKECSGDIKVDQMEVSGRLPPGLSRLDTDPIFEGTPEQPGDWNVRVKLAGIKCREKKKDLTYPDETVRIHFHIEGDAPRKLP